MSERNRRIWKLSEEGDRPISTIFMLHEDLSHLITMVTFFCPLSPLFRRTGQPPPPKKYAQLCDISFDFRSTLAVCISEIIQVTDLISHQHDTCPLINEMHTRRNVCKLRKHASCHFTNWQNWAFSNSCFSRVQEDTSILLIASYSPHRGKCFKPVLKLVQRI